MNGGMIPMTSPMLKVRVNLPFKARSVETGNRALFPKGTILCHIEIGKEFVRFREIGGQGLYEVPKSEFTLCVKTISR
jgi:hypothetical protein